MGPERAHPFEPRLHHQLVGALHHPTANGPPSRRVGRIRHVVGMWSACGRHVIDALLQIRQRLAHRGGWDSSGLLDRGAHLLAQVSTRSGRPLVLETMRLLAQPAQIVGSQGLREQDAVSGSVGQLVPARFQAAAVAIWPEMKAVHLGRALLGGAPLPAGALAGVGADGGELLADLPFCARAGHGCAAVAVPSS